MNLNNPFIQHTINQTLSVPMRHVILRIIFLEKGLLQFLFPHWMQHSKLDIWCVWEKALLHVVFLDVWFFCSILVFIVVLFYMFYFFVYVLLHSHWFFLCIVRITVTVDKDIKNFLEEKTQQICHKPQQPFCYSMIRSLSVLFSDHQKYLQKRHDQDVKQADIRINQPSDNHRAKNCCSAIYHQWGQDHQQSPQTN